MTKEMPYQLRKLFFAIDISDKDKAMLTQWRNNNLVLPYQAISTDNFHITLAFLGKINSQQQQSLILFADEINKKISVDKRRLVIDHYGLFKKPKVLYLGLNTVPIWLSELAKQLSEKAIQLDIFQESRPYCPHLSIYRKAKNLTAYLPCELTLTINSFSLYQSISSSKGVKYSPLKTWLLP